MRAFDDVFSPAGVYAAWQVFVSGKHHKSDVLSFERHLEDNLSDLSEDLLLGTYQHSSYQTFFICDPKPRSICKAAVRDRVVHTAFFGELLQIYEPIFFSASYASRKGKGAWAAVSTVETYLRSCMQTERTVPYVLHLDVAQFFASVDHDILLRLLSRKIKDTRYLSLCKEVIESFQNDVGKGMPLGNITSQLFANVYLHEVDHYIIQTLGWKRYVRYNDDMFLVGADKEVLCTLSERICGMVRDEFFLLIPPKKRLLRRWDNGVDILGVVSYPHYRATRHRLRKKIERLSTRSIDDWRVSVSYWGMLAQSRGFLLQQRLVRGFFV